jgi:hypothetical protein
MKELIAAGLAAILLAPLPAGDVRLLRADRQRSRGRIAPAQWEKVIQLMHETGEQFSAADEAILAQVLVDAKLCQQDKISAQDFQARIDEAYAKFN